MLGWLSEAAAWAQVVAHKDASSIQEAPIPIPALATLWSSQADLIQQSFEHLHKVAKEKLDANVMDIEPIARG